MVTTVPDRIAQVVVLSLVLAVLGVAGWWGGVFVGLAGGLVLGLLVYALNGSEVAAGLVWIGAGIGALLLCIGLPAIVLYRYVRRPQGN